MRFYMVIEGIEKNGVGALDHSYSLMGVLVEARSHLVYIYAMVGMRLDHVCVCLWEA